MRESDVKVGDVFILHGNDWLLGPTISIPRILFGIRKTHDHETLYLFIDSHGIVRPDKYIQLSFNPLWVKL